MDLFFLVIILSLISPCISSQKAEDLTAEEPKAKTKMSNTGNNTNHGSLFESFKKCLLKNNLKSSSIVKRSRTSKKYKKLNYQIIPNLPQIYPLAYVLPLGESNIVATVSCGITTGIRVVPKSGGHSFWKYSYGDRDSVVVDLRYMKGVKHSGNTVFVEPGNLAGPLAWKLWNSGKVFIPGGSGPSVGISGLALGGGQGRFIRQYGLTTDYILEMNIATTRGLLTVNKTSNSDLFWALRGAGGGNFGIVTKFVFRVIPAPPGIFKTTLTYGFDSFDKVFASWQLLPITAPNSVYGRLAIKQGTLTLTLLDTNTTGSSTAVGIVEQTFPTPVDRKTAKLTFPEAIFLAAKETNPLKSNIKFDSPKDFRTVPTGATTELNVKTKSFYVERIVDPMKIGELRDFFKGQPKGTVVEFGSYGGAVNDVGESETAFIHRKGRLYLVILLEFYADSNGTSADSVSSGGGAWLEKFFDFGKEIFHHKETYQNYIDGEIRDYLERYYGANLPRLIQIKREYDPTNYFHFPQSIPPRIQSTL